MELDKTIKVCDYCYSEHFKYSRTYDNFDFIEKREISSCISCGGSICRHCMDRSIDITKGSKMYFYTLYLCAVCCVEKRIKDPFFQKRCMNAIADIEKKLSDQVKKEISTVETLYPVTQKKKGG